MRDDTKKTANSDGKLSLKAPRRIVLKKTVEGGSIKQNFSHGRSKSVVVEVRRKRTFIKAGSGVHSEDPTALQVAHEESSHRGSHEEPQVGHEDRDKEHHILLPMTQEERQAFEQESLEHPHPEQTHPGPDRAEQTHLEPDHPEQTHLEPGRPEPGHPGPERLEQARQEPERPEQAHLEQNQPEQEHPQPKHPEQAHLEQNQPEQEHPEQDGQGQKHPADPLQVTVQPVGHERPHAPEQKPDEIAPVQPQSVLHPTEQQVEKNKEMEQHSGKQPTGQQKVEQPKSNQQQKSGQTHAGRPRFENRASEKPTPPSYEKKSGAAETGKQSESGASRDKKANTYHGAASPHANRGAPGNAKAGRDKGRGRDRGGRPGSVVVTAKLPVIDEAAISLDGVASQEDDIVPELLAGVVVDTVGLEKTDGKRKLTRLQREEVARKKTEDLVTKRLSQLEELREQKRRIEEQRTLEIEGQRLTQNRETLKTKGKRKGRKGAGAASTSGSGGGQGGGGGGGGSSNQGRSGRGGREERRVEGPPAPVVREVIIPETITVAELASRMAVKSSKVIKLLFSQGVMVTINQVLDQDTATLLVEEMGHRTKQVSIGADIEAELADAGDHPEMLSERWPVVTVMGHVDHGKTSLLDAIRKTNVTAGEHGGITQHIGAYQVTTSSGKRITFLDTPGHAAFTAMRARGAKATDIVVLVVAADDGVMPQTMEAVSHAKDAGVPIVVAINKIDKPNANPDRVMQQLSEHGLVPEVWGGDTIFVPLSAKSGAGLENLEEMILLQAEMLNLRANPDRRARGVIIEANLDRGRGAVATCLVRNGTLRVGDVFVVGHEWGKIRGLLTDRGESVTSAGPSTPVEVIGLSGIPKAGDNLVVVPDERRAREIASFRAQKSKEQEQARQSPAKLDDLFDQIKEGEKADLKVVIKGDVQGSVEALSDALRKIEHPLVQVTVIHMGVGGINESDVMLAVASDAVVVGFNVRADAKARELSKREKVDLRFYNVIYNLVDDVKRAMEGMLESTYKENVTGHAQVRELFRISKVGNVAGCMVTDGVILRNSLVRLLRDNVVVHQGSISALKRFKEDAREVREGVECGISLDKFSDIKVGDIIEVFVREEVRPTISE
ncbi:MAG: translation initiation factor IF-2 [Magnetococcus sp. DMHC-1]|nr:translation initiation factor IF-2 [Magnetococcales bacterium]